VLEACTGSTAADSDKCRVPIRLALVAIKDGEGPVRDEVGGPAHPEIDLDGTPMMQAGKLRNAAQEKAELKDGAGCIADLDEADRMDADPTRISTNSNALLWLRATCEMLLGDCDSGKLHLRLARQTQSPGIGPNIIDDMVNDSAKRFCPVDQLPTWDRIDRLSADVYFAWTNNQAAACNSIATRLLAELDKAPKADDHEHRRVLLAAYTSVGNAGACLAKADQCARGKQLAQESIRRRGQATALAEPAYSERWEKAYPNCKGK
jgi:hypothetical protein